MSFIKKFYLILFITLSLVILTEIQSYSQGWKRYRREVFISLGASNFLGDLGGANNIGTYGILDFDFPSIRPVMNLGFLYKLGPSVDLKTSLSYGWLSGNDAYTLEKFRNHRNLSFRTSILQLHSQMEFFIIREREGHKYDIQGVKGWQNIKIASYLFFGAGGFYFNPKAKYVKSDDNPKGDDKWYALEPLSTEGQGLVPTLNKYSKLQFTIPVGIGFKYGIGKNTSIGIEYSLYKTFTDYIDDCSTRYFDDKYLKIKKGDKAVWFGNPHKKDYGWLNWKITAPGQQRGDPRKMDSYMYVLVTFYYKLSGGRFVIPLF